MDGAYGDGSLLNGATLSSVTQIRRQPFCVPIPAATQVSPLSCA